MSFKTLLVLFLIASSARLTALLFTNFDLFGDEAQYWLWSEDLDFGYYSKPPFLSWAIAVWASVFGNSFIALKTLPFVMYFFTSFVIYFVSLEIYRNKKLATITCFSFYLIPAVSVSSFLLSTDVMLVFFWSICLLVLLKIKKNPSKLNFLLLGIFLGLAFLVKYAAIYFILCLIILVIFDEEYKKIFNIKNKLFYIFPITTTFVVFPNIVWNFNNAWITLSHTSDNAGLDRASINIMGGIEFLLSQALMLGPILVLFFLFSFKKNKINFENVFLIIFSLPIFIVVFVESVLVRANANWAAVGLVSVLIFLITHAHNYSKHILNLTNFLNFTVCLVFCYLIGTTSNFQAFDRINGISSFASFLYIGPLSSTKHLIVQDRLLYSSLSYYLKDSEKIILTPYVPGSVYSSHFQINKPLNKTFDKDFVFLGDIKAIKYLDNKVVIKKITTKKTKFKKEPIKIYEISF